MQHGLAAGTLMPEVLGRELVREHYQALREEWAPTTATQDCLLREMARHLGALARAEQIEIAMLRRGARFAPRTLLDDSGEDDVADATLAAAGTSDAIERISRYRRQHERALLRTLAALRDVRAIPAAATQRPLRRLQTAFPTEAACEAYLAARLRDGDFCCPRCGGQRGGWIAARRLWQCRACRRQAGLRHGTVMAGSRISLLAWFRAIGLLLEKPGTSMAELAAVTHVHRRGTLHRMARRIRRAPNAPDASKLLAGLDQVCRAHPAGGVGVLS